MIYLLYALAAAMGLFLLWVIASIYLLMTPTKGRAINKQERGNRALILIDMQTDYTRREGKNSYRPEDVETLIGNVNALISKAEALDMPVVTIRQVVHGKLKIAVNRLLAGPEGLAGNPGIHFDDHIKVNPSADFEKERGDAFSTRAFEDWLAANTVSQLYIAGIDGCYCIKNTSFGARNRDYDVTIIEDATLTVFPDRWKKVRQQLKEAGARFSSVASPF
jgi:nicotinamidase-related amidase